jgi:hypothetical protein
VELTDNKNEAFLSEIPNSFAWSTENTYGTSYQKYSRKLDRANTKKRGLLIIVGSNIVPYVFSVDQAKELGISDRKASFLLSVIGIVNTFGQIIYGYIGDKKINLSLIYGLSISTAIMIYHTYSL